MTFWSLDATGSLCRPRFRFPGLLFTRWPGGVVRWRRRRISLPVELSLNRFFAPLCVFIFGIVFCNSCVLRWAQHHHHVPPVLQRRRLDLADLLHVLRQAHQEVSSALRVVLLAPAEHDRDLDLRALVEEALDVALLGVVVVDPDLGPELDLLDVDLRLVLPCELGFLLLLVAVLAVIHDPRDRRIGLLCDDDEIEVVIPRDLERLVFRLDPQLRAVFADQPDARSTDVLVERLVPGRPRRIGCEPSPGPQELLTKLPAPPPRATKPLRAAARFLVLFDSVEPPEA